MSLKREKSLFAHSRLYRQADEGSKAIFDYFSNPKNIGFTFIDYFGIDKVELNNKNDSSEFLKRIHAKVIQVSKNLSPYIFIPTLIDAISKQYYGKNTYKFIDIGIELKTSLAYIWNNVHESHTTHSRAISDLIDFIKLVELEVFAKRANDLLGIWDREKIVLSNEGLEYSEMVSDVLESFQSTISMKGRSFRTVSHTILGLWADLSNAIETIEAILNNKVNPSSSLFMNTLFSHIPANVDKYFWQGLWIRLINFVIIKALRSRLTDDDIGVTIFQPFATYTNVHIFKKSVLDRITDHYFWKKSWYAVRLKQNPSSMIVERPALRIDKKFEIYATSTSMIQDSLNYFVESSVFREANTGGVPLPHIVFQNIISKPFEEKTIALFRKYGFKCGNVNDKNVWMVLDMKEKLNNINNNSIPGEIDILAYHSKPEAVFVIECKVLGVPHNINQFKNVMTKLGEEDSEGFHAKLTKKVNWVKKLSIFAHFEEMTFCGIIVTDLELPTKNKTAPNSVISIDRLEVFLKSYFK